MKDAKIARTSSWTTVSTTLVSTSPRPIEIARAEAMKRSATDGSAEKSALA
jgi:hypothetical protein